MKVSIITPTLNSIKTIKRCIKSVQSQSYKEVEHIIVDGLSCDGTIEYVKELKQKYGNIKLVADKDRGIYDAMNKGIRQATGEVIHILNSDDFYTNSTIIETIVNLFLKNPNLDLIHGKVRIVNEKGEPYWELGRDVDRKRLLRKMYIAHPSVFIRKGIYYKYGLFCDSFRIAADYEFILRIWDKINKYFINDYLVYVAGSGISNKYVELSLRERTAVSIKYGLSMPKAFLYYYFDLAKSKYLFPIFLKIKERVT